MSLIFHQPISKIESRSFAVTPLALFCFLFTLLALTGCVSQFDYKPYRDNIPRSILILPPLNQSNSIEASDLILTALVKPIGEAGYYVFPPLAVEAYLREQGIPSVTEARDIPHAKLQEIFGADAALYVDILEWGEHYVGFMSATTVEISARLVDLKSGTLLWKGEESVADTSNSNSNSGLAGMAVDALIHAMTKTSKEDLLALGDQASEKIFMSEHSGLLLGPRRVNAELDRRGRPE